MKYTKPPLSFEKQIALLESRGMAIPDHDRALRYLSHINYYRLRAYWLPFETNTGTGHSFRPGTTFDSALTLYVFDRAGVSDAADQPRHYLARQVAATH